MYTPWRDSEMTEYDSARALARVLRTGLRNHHTVKRAANSALVRGAWRHAAPEDRAALTGRGNLLGALRRLQRERAGVS